MLLYAVCMNYLCCTMCVWYMAYDVHVVWCVNVCCVICVFCDVYKESLVWSGTSVIPALGRLRQEDCEFALSLGYMVRDKHINNIKVGLFSASDHRGLGSVSD